MASPPPYVPIDPELLRRLYVDERLTTDQIAARLGCSEITVRRRLRRFAIPVRPKGPIPHRQTCEIRWEPEVAYGVGLMATDGNLSGRKAQMSLISKDLDQVETLRRCFHLRAPIKQRRDWTGRLYHRVQWCDRGLYDWFVSIGLTPAKSLTLGPLAVPEEYFADFFRGCIDGDGSIKTYTDRYHVTKNPAYVYERLFVSLVSASQSFIRWMQESIARLSGVNGSVTVRTSGRPHPLWCLKYAKRESICLLRWMYYSPSVPCLARKRVKAEQFLSLTEIGVFWCRGSGGTWLYAPHSKCGARKGIGVQIPSPLPTPFLDNLPRGPVT